ncbi:MAG: hypothetical protein AAGA31_20775, partial [Bacteroidota bacterium]
QELTTPLSFWFKEALLIGSCLILLNFVLFFLVDGGARFTFTFITVQIGLVVVAIAFYAINKKREKEMVNSIAALKKKRESEKKPIGKRELEQVSQ